ncbi:hypothetical protein LNKW23_02720 [Paralimibaculum aggregatum]|uniref:Uncharacterized protein n=1 Tax=Paralimibaculum aggregatum TaxID=3036245 RepID=A0ABQ6LCF0_9RHOB|nr:hypothetical protein [Limibaculum sp. NKW23]GMG81060.1 hypothetical protein LNKW23_02720 [Limibaculum sp. NKW23]
MPRAFPVTHLPALLALLGLAACAGAPQVGDAWRDVEEIARHADWRVLKIRRRGETTCLALNTDRLTQYFRGRTPLPPESRPVSRGLSGLALASHPSLGVMPFYKAGTEISAADQMAILAGPEQAEYPLARDPQRPDSARPQDLGQSGAIAAELLRAPEVYVATITPGGVTIMDRFDTAGAGAAIAAAQGACAG